MTCRTECFVGTREIAREEFAEAEVGLGHGIFGVQAGSVAVVCDGSRDISLRETAGSAEGGEERVLWVNFQGFGKVLFGFSQFTNSLQGISSIGVGDGKIFVEFDGLVEGYFFGL